MDIHTHAYVKLLLSPRQSRGISYWINFQVFLYLKINHTKRYQLLN